MRFYSSEELEGFSCCLCSCCFLRVFSPRLHLLLWVEKTSFQNFLFYDKTSTVFPGWFLISWNFCFPVFLVIFLLLLLLCIKTCVLMMTCCHNWWFGIMLNFSKNCFLLGCLRSLGVIYYNFSDGCNLAQCSGENQLASILLLILAIALWSSHLIAKSFLNPPLERKENHTSTKRLVSF